MGDVREVRLEDRDGVPVIVLGLHGIEAVGSVGMPPMDDAAADDRWGVLVLTLERADELRGELERVIGEAAPR